MRYVVFAKESCPYCVKTVELLEDKEQIKEACRWETVPMIFKVSDENKIKFVGGYTDLTAIFDGD